MEEHKNHNKVSRLIIVLVIAVTVIIAILAYLMISQKSAADKEIAALKASEAELQATVAELQGKLGNISDIASKEDNESAKISTESETNTESTSNSVTKSEDSIANNIIGNWKFYRVYTEGVLEDDWRSIFGSAGLGRGLVLKEDNTFIDEVGVANSSEENSTEGTYEVSGNNITLRFSNGVVKNLKYDPQNETIDFPNYWTDCELVLKKSE